MVTVFLEFFVVVVLFAVCFYIFLFIHSPLWPDGFGKWYPPLPPIVKVIKFSFLTQRLIYGRLSLCLKFALQGLLDAA